MKLVNLARFRDCDSSSFSFFSVFLSSNARPFVAKTFCFFLVVVVLSSCPFLFVLSSPSVVHMLVPTPCNHPHPTTHEKHDREKTTKKKRKTVRLITTNRKDKRKSWYLPLLHVCLCLLLLLCVIVVLVFSVPVLLPTHFCSFVFFFRRFLSFRYYLRSYARACFIFTRKTFQLTSGTGGETQ